MIFLKLRLTHERGKLHPTCANSKAKVISAKVILLLPSQMIDTTML